jgi:FkbM family methyltransferase
MTAGVDRFLPELLTGVLAAAQAPPGDGNEDLDRYPDGTPEPTAGESAERLEAILGRTRELEWLWARLEPTSRTILLERLAYTVLGHRRIIVGPGPERWEQLLAQAREELMVEAETEDLHYGDGTFAHRFDLAPLGFPIVLESYLFGVQGTFQVQQYRCPHVPEARVRPGDVVLDGGGFFGETALYFAHESGPHGRVICLEFAAHNLAILERNLAANPDLAARIEVDHRALWHTTGEELHISLGGPATTVIGLGESYATVPSVRIDDLDAERIDFIKLDIEGAESAALAGATETLRRWRPRLAIAAYHGPDDVWSLPRQIDALGLGYRFALGHFTIHDEETVLFAWVDGA